MIDIILAMLLSFWGTKRALPHSIRKLREKGYLAKDMYKPGTPKIPTNGGIIVLFVSYITISLLPLVSRILNKIDFLNFQTSDFSEMNLALLVVISIFGLYGLVDDLVDIGRLSKLFMPIIFGIPLISVVSPDIFWFPMLGNIDLSETFFSDITLSDIFKVLVIPLYVMVVSNLINMHSGYNGLQTGLSIILLATLIIKSALDNKEDNIIPAGAFLGSMIAFYLYNKYPSRVFEGNIGSLTFGSLIGSIIVIQEYWWFGFFILFPHTINFLQWVIWILKIRKNPDIFLINGRHEKFGKIRDDGSIKVPNWLTLKWVPNYFFKIDERHSTHISYSITLLFCIFGLAIFN